MTATFRDIVIAMSKERPGARVETIVALIDAIKELRALTKASLLQAKNAIDSVIA